MLPGAIRQADVEECLQLTQLALTSKAHWGYSVEFMRACENELCVTRQKLQDTNLSYYLYECGNFPEVRFNDLPKASTSEHNREKNRETNREKSTEPDKERKEESFDGASSQHKHVIKGFYALKGVCDEQVELDALFVDPLYFKQGIGKMLFHHAVSVAQHQGYREIVVTSDPHAQAFYTAVGAIAIGQEASGSIPGRYLPVLSYKL